MNILNIEHINKIYGDKIIFDDISCGIQQGEKIGIIGVNGTGKTTLLRVIAGEEEPDEGQVITQNGIRISWLPQTPEFPDHMTILDYVAEGKWQKDWSTESEARRMLNDLGITDQSGTMDTLSGGEKKLVSIATILSMMPEVLLMDEPSIALDPRNRRSLIHILNSLDQPKIIASHDLDMIWDTCPRTILLSDGEIVCDGATEEILCDRELLESNGLELPLGMQKIVTVQPAPFAKTPDGVFPLLRS